MRLNTLDILAFDEILNVQYLSLALILKLISAINSTIVILVDIFIIYQSSRYHQHGIYLALLCYKAGQLFKFVEILIL